MRREVTVPLPRERIHTYYFLQFAKRLSPVYVTTEVDMSAVVRRRRALQIERGLKVSYLAFLIEQAARVLDRYPEANAAVQHGWFPKYRQYGSVHAKFTIDKHIGATRVVVPGLVENAHQASLESIQERIDYFRTRPLDDIAELDGIRKLQRCPRFLGQWLFNMLLSPLKRRGRLQGTFAVTSLGHRPVHAFLPVVSATICFGMGAIEDRAVAVNGVVEVRPTMTLSMAFDHCAIDGALAADLLADVKSGLECGGRTDEDEVTAMACAGVRP
jgi:pyruvate/2-oxoglutarate dehydrogenase complex dihydrolipoamide acyltransferase (E2) component